MKYGHNGRFLLFVFRAMPICSSSRSPRASPETSQSRSGMRRPAHVARNHVPGRRPAKPPFRHYERNARMRQCETEEHRPAVQRSTVSPRWPGANNRRGGAPRGERSRWNARRPSWRLRAYVTRPPTGAAAPERLSALRFPHCLMRENGKPRRSLCLARTMTLARFVGRAKARLRAVPTRCV